MHSGTIESAGGGRCDADNYIHGEVDRISPEAPVPVILVNKRKQAGVLPM